MNTIRGLSDRIRKARARAGLTQEEASAKHDMNRAIWAQYETGDCNPSAKNLSKICLSVDVSADYLLGITPQMDNADTYSPMMKDMLRLTPSQRNIVWRLIGVLADENDFWR